MKPKYKEFSTYFKCPKCCNENYKDRYIPKRSTHEMLGISGSFITVKAKNDTLERSCTNCGYMEFLFTHDYVKEEKEEEETP